MGGMRHNEYRTTVKHPCGHIKSYRVTGGNERVIAGKIKWLQGVMCSDCRHLDQRDSKRLERYLWDQLKKRFGSGAPYDAKALVITAVAALKAVEASQEVANISKGKEKWIAYMAMSKQSERSEMALAKLMARGYIDGRKKGKKDVSKPLDLVAEIHRRAQESGS